MNVVHGENPPAPWYFATAAPAFDGPFSSAWLTPNCGSLFPGVICHNPHPVVAYGWPCCTASGLNPLSAPVIAAAMWEMNPPGPPAPVHQFSICRRLALPRPPFPAPAEAAAASDLMAARIAAISAFSAVVSNLLSVFTAYCPDRTDVFPISAPDANPGTPWAFISGATAGVRCFGTTVSPPSSSAGYLSPPPYPGIRIPAANPGGCPDF